MRHCWRIALVVITCCLGWLAVSRAQTQLGSGSRARRQIQAREEDAETCSDDTFLCTSGECIDKLNVCDGTAHCSDQSDERIETCRGEKCPAYAHRCAYGACIDITSKCDGKDDCVDRSDETLPECAKRCGEDEFECVSDETCVDELLLCDGKRDCGDGSDENPALCANFSCPGYAFHCTYGGCIDNVGLCDGKPDCADNSDEGVALCRSQTNRPPPPRSTTTRSPPPVRTVKPTNPPSQATQRPVPVTQRPVPVTNPRPAVAVVATQRPATARPRPAGSVTTAPVNTVCVLPPPPQHGSYNVSGCQPGDQSAQCRAVPGSLAPMSLILVHTCALGYAMQGSTFSVCQNNATWTPPIPTCTQRTAACPPLSSASVEIVCSRAGVTLNCSHDIPIGAEARLKCNTAYILQGEPGYRKITCQTGGTWDKPIFSCTPDCGKRNPNGRPFISNGEVAVVGEYPWHAGIYMVSSGVPTQVCGGTLISTKLIVSAAHCFWDEGFSRPRDKALFKVALGKYYRDWNVEDSEAQKFDIADVFVEERYRGRKRNFQFDIAVIRLSTEAELTWAVNTVCVDWDNDLEAFQLITGANGTVTGWGVTEANEPSNVLKSVQLPYVQLFPTCYDTVMESFQPFLTSDKFCAGYVNRKTSVCPGDSGGGLVFQHSTSKRYFLRGIVSVGSKPETNADRCYTQQLTAFSKFSESRKWVEQYL